MIDKHIEYCTGCFSCMRNGGTCVHDDDMQEILEEILSSDLLIWSFPLYCYGMPAPLKDFDETADSCEIGYGIGSRFWNQGYATEAVHRFLEYLFQEKGLKTVYASFFTGNDASRSVMEKCGMRYSHFSEKELTYLDVPRDLTYYVISLHFLWFSG